MSELARPVIYTLTVVSTRRRDHRSRCWGWWPTEAAAVAALEAAPDAFFEDDYYHLAVIEEVPAGVNWINREIWFEAVYERDTEGCQVSCSVRPLDQKPADLEKAVAWSMG